MITVPLEYVLTWPKGSPNTINPERRGPVLWIVSSVFLSIATISVFARLYHRIFVRHWFGQDDVLIIVAYVNTIAVTTTAAVGNVYFDWDKHIWDLQQKHIPGSLLVLYMSRIFWGVATSSVRLSILCLYYRLLERCNGPKRFRMVLHGVTTFTIGLLFYYIFTGLFPCIPVRAYWTWPPLPHQKCINDGLSMEVAAVLNTVSEFVIAVLPIFAIFGLRVDPRQRWSVIGLLSLGFFVAFAGCFRTYYLWKTVATYDMTWWSTPHWICSEVEIDVALTCACAASLRPLIGRFVGRMKGINLELPKTLTKLSKLSQNSTTMSNGTDLSTLNGNLGWDHEGQTNWTTLMSRTIDLEGIGEDGFGYTVTITGPPRPRKRHARWNRATKSSVQPQDVVQEQSFTNGRLSNERKTLEVVTNNTFEIEEVFRDRDLIQQPKRSFQEAKEEYEHYNLRVEAVEWSLLDTPEVVTALPEVRKQN